MEKPKRSRKRKDLPVILNGTQPIIVVKSPLVGGASSTKPLNKTPTPTPTPTTPIPTPPIQQPSKPVNSPVSLTIPKKLETTVIPRPPVQQQPLVKKVSVQIPSHINVPASPPPIKSINNNVAIIPKAIKPSQPKKQLTIDESFKRVLSPAIIEPPIFTHQKTRVQPPPPSYNTIVTHKKQQNQQQLSVPKGGAILFKHTKPAMAGQSSSLQELERKRTIIRQQHQIELEKIRHKQAYIHQLERKQKEAELLKNIQQEKLYLNKLEAERRKLEQLEQLRKTQLQQQQQHTKRLVHNQQLQTTTPAKFNLAKYEELKEHIEKKNNAGNAGNESKRILKYPKPVKYSADGIPLVQKTKKRVQFKLNYKELEELKHEIETPSNINVSEKIDNKNHDHSNNDFDEITIDTRKSKWKVDKSSKKNKDSAKDLELELKVDAPKKTKVILDDEDDDVFIPPKKKNEITEKLKSISELEKVNEVKEVKELKYNKKFIDKMWIIKRDESDIKENACKEISVNIGINKDTDIPKVNKIKAQLLDEEIFNNPEKFKKTELKLFYGITASKGVHPPNT
jgi:hypothetical protein